MYVLTEAAIERYGFLISESFPWHNYTISGILKKNTSPCVFFQNYLIFHYIIRIDRCWFSKLCSLSQFLSVEIDGLLVQCLIADDEICKLIGGD